MFRVKHGVVQRPKSTETSSVGLADIACLKVSVIRKLSDIRVRQVGTPSGRRFDQIHATAFFFGLARGDFATFVSPSCSILERLIDSSDFLAQFWTIAAAGRLT